MKCRIESPKWNCSNDILSHLQNSFVTKRVRSSKWIPRARSTRGSMNLSARSSLLMSTPHLWGQHEHHLGWKLCRVNWKIPYEQILHLHFPSAGAHKRGTVSLDVGKVLRVRHPVIILPWTRSWCLIEFFSVWIKLLPVNIYWFPAPLEPRSHSQDKNTSLLFILGQSLTSAQAEGADVPPVCLGRLHGTLSTAAILPVLLLPVPVSLEVRPAAPSLCQRRCLARPQIKKRQRGRREKWPSLSLRTYVKNASVLR